MQMAENKNPYFFDLEQLTKAGLVAYLILLVAGLTLAAEGVEIAYDFMVNIELCCSLLVTIVSLNVVYMLIRGVNRVHWLGELHVWLDKRLFGFLLKSNEIIFGELVILLEPNELLTFDARSRNEKTVIAQSILSHLAEDPSILESLLRKGIFRSWIWYWISLYGVLAFVLLTVFTFLRYVLVPSLSSKAFLISIGVVAVFHVIFSFLSGYNIMRVTRRIIREMIHLHRAKIVSFLRNYPQGKGAQ